MTLTKEWLLKTISELEEERDATPGTVNEDAAMALAAMKLALASLEAEPVAFIGQRMLEELTDGARSCGRVWPKFTNKLSDENRIPLYTAPPALVVPDEMPDSVYDILCQACGDKAWMYGDTLWNACRAAMLQGAAGNSPAIPDGYALVPVEPTKEMIEAGWSYYMTSKAPGSSGVYSAMLAAAPQQEVK